MLEYGFSLTRCSRASFLYRKIQVRVNPYCGIFYAVNYKHIIPRVVIFKTRFNFFVPLDNVSENIVGFLNVD